MFNISVVYKLAKKSNAAVGIGCASECDAVLNSVERAGSVGYAQAEAIDTPGKLISSLKNGKIQAAVRGNLGAKEVLDSLKTAFNLEKIMRVAFMKTDKGRLVLLSPVGVDEGQSIEERLELVNFACELLSKFRVAPQAGVLSGGRLEDMGRHIKVDETLISGEKLTNLALDSGIAARHFGIQIEQAFLTSNVVIAPDGITGNFIFRTMHFLGGMKGIGAPVAGLGKTFVDTSRAKRDYTDSIALASALRGLN